MIKHNDYYYYSKWNFESIFDEYTGEKGYIYLQPWPGGFNNIRMSLELAICLTYLTDRILVLPPTYRMYLLEGDSNIEDFFDLSQLGVKHLTFVEFCNLKNIEPTIESVKKISKVNKYDSVTNVITDSRKPLPFEFYRGRQTIKLHQIIDNSEVIFFDKNLLGTFYTSIFSDKQIALHKLIAQYVTLRKDVFNLAAKYISLIGDGKYYSLHIRRNDFQYTEVKISAEEILVNISSTIPKGSKLYISTDHNTDDEFFLPFKENYDVYFFKDLNTINEDYNLNWIPLLEMLICTRGIRFVGTRLSTFSSYIYRLRGYMDDIQDKSYYVNTETFDIEKQGKFLKNTQFNGNWAREYPDAWNFTL